MFIEISNDDMYFISDPDVAKLQSKKKLVIHILGVEKELDILPVFYVRYFIAERFENTCI